MLINFYILFYDVSVRLIFDAFTSSLVDIFNILFHLLFAQFLDKLIYYLLLLHLLRPLNSKILFQLANEQDRKP
jgi:hypothetical protein